eukprot:1364903-Amphidinium_carterae.1
MSWLSPPQRNQRWRCGFLTPRLEQDGLVNIKLKPNFIETGLPSINHRLSGMLGHAKDRIVTVRQSK